MSTENQLFNFLTPIEPTYIRRGKSSGSSKYDGYVSIAKKNEQRKNGRSEISFNTFLLKNNLKKKGETGQAYFFNSPIGLIVSFKNPAFAANSFNVSGNGCVTNHALTETLMRELNDGAVEEKTIYFKIESLTGFAGFYHFKKVA